MIDFSSKFGQRVLDRLKNEQVIWLTAIDDRGYAQPNPVWFLWEDDSLLIYSIPKSRHVRYIEARPQVTLHFNTDQAGNDVMVLTGEARLDPSAPPGDQHPEYLEKYSQGIKDINMSPESFAKDYSAAFRVRPTHLRGF